MRDAVEQWREREREFSLSFFSSTRIWGLSMKVTSSYLGQAKETEGSSTGLSVESDWPPPLDPPILHPWDAPDH